MSGSTSRENHLLSELSKYKSLIQFRDILTNETKSLNELNFSMRPLESKLYDGLIKLEHNNLIIEKPRLSILIEESSYKLIDLLNEQKTNSTQNDNIIYEALITCPKSTRLNLNQLIPFDNQINMVHLFFAIKTFNRSK